MLVIDNIYLDVPPNSKDSGNVFAAAKCLEVNRKLNVVGGKIANDVIWQMKILPEIAQFFGVSRIDLLEIWVQDFGVALLEKEQEQ